METLLACVLMMAISFLVSYCTAQACLCAVIHFMARRGFGSEVRPAMFAKSGAALDEPVMALDRKLAERAALRVKQQNGLHESTVLHECDHLVSTRVSSFREMATRAVKVDVQCEDDRHRLIKS